MIPALISFAVGIVVGYVWRLISAGFTNSDLNFARAALLVTLGQLIDAIAIETTDPKTKAHLVRVGAMIRRKPQ